MIAILTDILAQAAPAPDSGLTALLLGGAVIAIGVFARFFGKK